VRVVGRQETLAELLGDGLGTALVRADDGERESYGQFAEQVDDVAGRLRALGVDRGDRVALVIPDGPSLLTLLLGVAAIGAAAAPLNPAYTEDEYAFYLDDLAPAALVLAEGAGGAARRAVPEGVRVLRARGSQLEGSRRATYEPARADDVALLLHTSGTTSRPKQVPLRHRNLTTSARSIAAFYALTDTDVSYCAMPLFHVHGLVASALAALCSGGTVVVPRRFLPKQFWGHLDNFGVTWMSGGPTLHAMALDQRVAAGAPMTLRFVRSCSSALSPSLLEQCEAAYGVPMLEAYGMTEASHQITSNPLPPGSRLAGSVGVPVGNEVRVVDERGRDVAVGEVAIRGPSVMSGYLANDSANAAAFIDDWFRTGDLGRLDDGYLYLEGRIKELIIRGGENISPGEIEDALRRHDSVLDAVAFGIKNEKYGEEVGAAVTLKQQVEQSVLQAHCRESLAPFKIPVKIFVIPEIPRTATGKVQRRRIAEQLLG
jgi:acyl-CoA synthetase (AMP-forming)/AMP-acid ligase II